MPVIEVHLLEGYKPEERRRLSESLTDAVRLVVPAPTEAFQSAGDEAIVFCRGTLSGEWLDGSSFEGVRFVDRFELINRMIARQDVWNDLAEAQAIA